MQGFIGEIRLFGGNFNPRTWAFCEGQLMSISSNTALFSILGTTYGGDGRTTFGLPDLRGRTAVSEGQGPGLRDVTLGEKSGIEEESITVAQLASHNHIANIAPGAEVTVNIPAVADSANAASPEGNIFATGEDSSGGEIQTFSTSNADANLMAVPATVTGDLSITQTGSGLPINNMQPSLGLNYIICLQGTYPSRS
ncbi:MAG: phage tail protein [Verrucomicrobia bacterium]|nr:phage tail protein [Verrucomicrobiota bacterium]|tara:strand:- start:851 stop:1441 length:591 start_codon:yes stop_codon:yes gene_type:complete